MTKRSRAKLVFPKPGANDQILEAIKKSNSLKQNVDSALTKLDNEIQCL